MRARACGQRPAMGRIEEARGGLGPGNALQAKRRTMRPRARCAVGRGAPAHAPGETGAGRAAKASRGAAGSVKPVEERSGMRNEGAQIEGCASHDPSLKAKIRSLPPGPRHPPRQIPPASQEPPERRGRR